MPVYYQSHDLFARLKSAVSQKIVYERITGGERNKKMVSPSVINGTRKKRRAM